MSTSPSSSAPACPGDDATAAAAWRQRWTELRAQIESKQPRAAVQAARWQEMEQQVAKLEAQLRQREDKIRRMQGSVSWRLTAPLRALRRLVWNQPPPPPEVLLALDAPLSWSAAPAKGRISGWACLVGGKPLAGVRVSIDGQGCLPLRQGLARPDVAAAHGWGNESVACGFELGYALEVDRDYTVCVETSAGDGRWRLRETRVLHTSRQPNTRDYATWVETYSRMHPEKVAALNRRLAGLSAEQQPVISVVLPVYNPPERWLVRALESVREQLYPQWELCVADDASTQPYVRAVLERFRQADPRIKVVYRTGNGHISRASNSALELATGSWIVLLDHDDELAPEALAEVVLHQARQPGVALWYSDEDKIDEEGQRFSPYFKPDFLPELLTGQNFLMHLSAYRTDLVRAAGGFRVGYEGSQDWDLALRLVERVAPDQVGHIPQVLYHWRAIRGSTALAIGEKDYTVAAAQRALQDHFQRRGLAVTLQPVPGYHWRVVYPLPERRPLVSLIIPSYNATDILRQCLASIRERTDYAPYEILVVNNRSDDPDALAFLHWVQQDPVIRVVDYPAPFSYSALNNFAVQHARGEVLCLLNNDIEVITPGWLTEMVSHAVRPEIGAVGAMLYYPDDTIQHAGVFLGLGGVAGHAFLRLPRGHEGQMNRARLVQNYSAVTAACLVVRRAVYAQVGGLNESDLAIAFNDIDFCLKVRAAGFRNVWTPFAELYHHESASRGLEDTPEKQARFKRESAYMRRTWGALLDQDPAYNPNLSLEVGEMGLAWPPRL